MASPYLIGGTTTPVGGNGAKFGCTNAGAAAGKTLAQTIAAWSSNVTKIEFLKVYCTQDEYPLSFTGWGSGGQAQYAIANNVRMAICWKPTCIGTTGPNNLPTNAQYQADQNSMLATISFLKGQGMTDFKNVVWQEQEQQHAGFPSAAQYLSVCNFNYQALHNTGGKVVCDSLAYQYTLLPSYFPGPEPGNLTQNGGVLSCDEASTDMYGDDYRHGSGTQLPLIQSYAAQNQIPGPGVYEMGDSVGGPRGTLIQMQAYLTADMSNGGDNQGSCEAQALLTKAAGNNICDSAWYQNDAGSGSNIIQYNQTPPDFRIALLQELAASVRPLRLAIGVNTHVSNGDTIWVFAMATAGTTTRVYDTQGNTYTLVDKETDISGLTLWTWACFNAQPATGSGNALKTSPQDVIQVDYSSANSVQCAVALGDPTAATVNDVLQHASNLSSLQARTTATPTTQPENIFFAAVSSTAGDTPSLGPSLNQLALQQPGTAGFLIAGWRQVTNLSAVTTVANYGLPTNWAAVMVGDPLTGTQADVAGAVDGIAVNTGGTSPQLIEAAGAADVFLVFGPKIPHDAAGAAENFSVFNPSAIIIQLADTAAVVDDSGFSFADFETRVLPDAAGVSDGIQVAVSPSEWVITATSTAGDTVSFVVSPGELVGINIAVGQTFQLYTGGGSLEGPTIYTIESIG